MHTGPYRHTMRKPRAHRQRMANVYLEFRAGLLVGSGPAQVEPRRARVRATGSAQWGRVHRGAGDLQLIQMGEVIFGRELSLESLL